MMLARCVMLACALLPLLGTPARAQRSTIVILVRHGEKAATPGPDPALSEAGRARAHALDSALAGAGVDAILTTPFERTQATAAPVATRFGLTPESVPVSGGVASYAAAVASAVRGRLAGRTVLVVGHSNTIPAVIQALGGPAIADLCEGEYATMLVLILPPGEAPQLIRASYGAPDPQPMAGCARGMR